MLKRLMVLVVSTLVLTLVPAVTPAFASGNPTCHYGVCGIGGGGSGGGGSPLPGGPPTSGGGGGGGSFAPPPPEPLCIDQGSNPRPQLNGSPVTINGVIYDPEYISCSSTITAHAKYRANFGSVTTTPSNIASSNPSCNALNYWVDPNTAQSYHTDTALWGSHASYWGVRAGYGYYYPSASGIGAGRAYQIASFCTVWFYAEAGTVHQAPPPPPVTYTYTYSFEDTTSLNPSLPSPSWQTYNLPQQVSTSRTPGGAEYTWPPYHTSNNLGYGATAMVNEPYIISPNIPQQALNGSVSQSADVIVHISLSNGFRTTYTLPNQVILGMSYQAVPQSVNIASTTYTGSSNSLMNGPVLLPGAPTSCSITQINNSAQFISSDATYDYETGNPPSAWSPVGFTPTYCETGFRIPSVTPVTPTAGWPLTATGNWNVIYTASYNVNPFTISVDGTQVHIQGTSGTLTASSPNWINNPSGIYHGGSNTINVPVVLTEGVPYLG